MKKNKEEEKRWEPRNDKNENLDMSDELDLAKAVVNVYGENRDLNENYVMSKTGDKGEEFIRQEYLAAQVIRNMMLNMITLVGKDSIDKTGKTPRLNKQERKEVERIAGATYNLIMSETLALAILSRNKISNPIVMKIIIRSKEQAEKTATEEPEEKGILKRISGRIFRKNKKEEDEDNN